MAASDLNYSLICRHFPYNKIFCLGVFQKAFFFQRAALARAARLAPISNSIATSFSYCTNEFLLQWTSSTKNDSLFLMEGICEKHHCGMRLCYDGIRRNPSRKP